jgi:dihydropteroate synthase
MRLVRKWIEEDFDIMDSDEGMLILAPATWLRFLAGIISTDPRLSKLSERIRVAVDSATSSVSYWVCGRHRIEIGRRTIIMGILNVTPDSFSDGGLYMDPDSAVRRAVEMVEEGADIIDVGGESTRPGADPVPVEEEMRRVIPVISRLVKEIPDIPISVDTYKAEVARAAVEEGASIVNDISAMRMDPKMVDVLSESSVGVVLMHMKGTPKDMQLNPRYDHPISEIYEFLQERVEFAEARGIDRSRIVVDPGIGFGKDLGHNLEIIRRVWEFRSLGFPVLIGPSRKSFIGKVLGLPVDERVEGTGAVVSIAIAYGADIVRVHDVKEMARVARMADSIVRDVVS